MPLDVFIPPRKVTVPGSGVDSAPRVNSAKFGDGYSQRSGDGLNDVDDTFSGQCSMLTAAQASTLVGFFKAHTSTPFLWTPPLTGVQSKWIATSWSQPYGGSGKLNVSFKLEKVFDL
jgi:phage-related protein